MPTENRQTELLVRLTEGIATLTDSERWKHHLRSQAAFHRYSFGNVVLIAAQCPDDSQVAGFRTWQRLGRTVRRGERALWILAPMRARRRSDGDDEAPVRGFRTVAVFDISQTEGEELPEVCHRLEGGDPGACFGPLVEVAGTLGYQVEVGPVPGGANGDCSFARRRIRVEEANAPAQRVKTLVHEIAHALLHEGEGDRALAELEAESVAYVVSSTLGLDTGAYSFGYVATWAGGGEEALAGIRSSGASIQRASAFVLEALDSDPTGVPTEDAPAPVGAPAGPDRQVA